MQNFKPHRVSISEALPGDILIFKGKGLWYHLLSRLIKKWKEPNWDKWGWHMAPLVSQDEYMDAQWPRLKLSSLSQALKAGAEIRAYRIFPQIPPLEKRESFIQKFWGRRYDWFAYILTACAALLRPHIDVPRIINRSYTCWETAFEFADFCGISIEWDYFLPWLPDFLRYVGEL
jgi:hypothetical protein